MKKITTLLFMFVVLSISLPQNVLAGSAVNITKDGAATATELKVMQIAGGTFFARLYWGLAYVRVTVKTNNKTKFYRGTGELTTMSEIVVGDVLDISGELEPDSSTLTFIASTVKNSSVQKQQTIASGKVANVDLGQRSFSLISPKLGLINVIVRSSTTFKKGNRTLDLEHMRAGDTITKATGDYDLTTKTLMADSVITYIDLNYYKPQNFEGTIQEVSVTTLPATLRVLIGKNTFTVNLNEKTSLMNKKRGALSLSRYIVGDSVRIYGSIREVDEAILDAEIVRNMSL